MNSKKRALGKGLGALLGNTDYTESLGMPIDRLSPAIGTIAKVALASINSNPFQPREHFDEESLKDLAASIKEQGVIQPVTLILAEESGKFTLVAGERRFRAAQMAGFIEIPAYIIEADESKMLELAIIENIQREDLNPLEIALGYKQLLERYQLTQEMVAEKVGKSRSSVANYVRLLNLPGEIQIGLRSQKISMGHARALIAVDNHSTQIDIYHDIVEQGLSVRDVEEIVKSLNEAKPDVESKKPGKKPPREPNLEKYGGIQLQLTEILGAKVQFKNRGTTKGAIVINFSSEEDLQRILSLINIEVKL